MRPPTRHPFGIGAPMEARLRHTYVVGGVALLVVGRTVRGIAPVGTPVDLRGTAADVARREPDGTWRYLVDIPFGPA